VLAVALLVAGVAGALTRPWRLPAWAAPAAAAVIGVVTHADPDPGHLLRPLGNPIAFLLAAVPLAALLDRLGFFAATAELLEERDSRHLARDLWILAAGVTTILNLDASVVLLTPLYVRIARRVGADPLSLAVQPVLLACLASSALPVSNLTNLIAASARHLDAAAFATHLGPPSLAATTVGWFAYRRLFPPPTPQTPPPPPRPSPAPAPTSTPTPTGLDRRPLAVGAVIVAGVLGGFVAGPAIGIPEWVTALTADIILVGVTGHVPLADLPWGTALVAGTLGVLAGGAASHVPIAHLLSGGGDLALVRVTLLAAGAANLVNNLPALLVALPHPADTWALLLGVNIGPLVLVTGTLATLLWQASLRRLGVEVSAARFARIGATVVVPSLAAALAVLLAMRPLVGG
jgi:arsenical pump membrane protein